jgi:hypothetical protein
MKILDLLLIVAVSSILAASCQKQTSQISAIQTEPEQLSQPQFKFMTEYGPETWGKGIDKGKKQRWKFAGGLVAISSFDIWEGEEYTYIDGDDGILKYDLTGNYMGMATNTDMCQDVAQNTGQLEHYYPSSELSVTVDVNTPSIFYVERIRGSKGIAN